MMLTGLGNPWIKIIKYFNEEMYKQSFQNIMSLKLLLFTYSFFTMMRVKSLFKKNSWLPNGTHLSHSEETNYLQWTVCEIGHLLAVCKLFMDKPQLMNTLKLLKYLLGTDFSPWGFCLFALCGTPAMHQLVFQTPVVLNRCWMWAAIWISALQETPWFLFLSIPHVGISKNKSEVSCK